LIIIIGNIAHADEDPEIMFNMTKDHLVNGEYKKAITIYDNILETYPNNISTLKMKGIAHSLGQHTSSLK